MSFENQNNQIETKKQPETLELASVQIERGEKEIETCDKELTKEVCTKCNNVFAEELSTKNKIDFYAALNTKVENPVGIA